MDIRSYHAGKDLQSLVGDGGGSGGMGSFIFAEPWVPGRCKQSPLLNEDAQNERKKKKNRKDHQPFSSYPSHQPHMKGAYLLQFIASKISPPLLELFSQHALGFASYPDY